MRWLQNPNQSSVDSLYSVRREASKTFQEQNDGIYVMLKWMN